NGEPGSRATDHDTRSRDGGASGQSNAPRVGGFCATHRWDSDLEVECGASSGARGAAREARGCERAAQAAQFGAGRSVMKRYAIMVTTESDRECAQARCDTNPEAIAEGAIAKTRKILHKTRWLRVRLYQAVRIVDRHAIEH